MNLQSHYELEVAAQNLGEKLEREVNPRSAA
jgi:plasmid maintenance system antidote protein VapI